METAPVAVLFYDIRKLLEGGHTTAVQLYVDELEKRFNEMTTIPF